MKKLKIKFLRQYRKRTSGQVVFVYAVTGDEKQLKAYEKSKGENFKKDEESKEALFFSTRFVGKSGELMETSKNEWVVDTTEADQMKSLVDQYGYDIAKQMMHRTEE